MRCNEFKHEKFLVKQKCKKYSIVYRVVVNLRVVPLYVPHLQSILLFLFLQTGEELIDGNHYASHEIEARIETLNTHWQNLSEK